jgi:small-conductance mechanosensitive channel
MSFDFLQEKFLENRVGDYLVAFAIAVAGILAIKVLQTIVIHRLKSWAKKTASNFDDALVRLIEHSLIPILYLGTFYIALENLTLNPLMSRLISAALLIAATLIAIRLLTSIAEYFLRLYWREKGENDNLRQMSKALLPAIRTVAWALGIIFVLDNLGFNVSAVLAGLGIGGVAIALASQGVLEDLFCYFAILLDRPFEIGDFIIAGDLMGEVEQVGIKTTRLRSTSGEEIVVCNKDLTNSRIQNFKRMRRRRVAFKFGVTYQTNQEQLQAIPALVERIIEDFDTTLFDRAHFSDYGEFSLNFEVVYYVHSSDYNLYMDIQQQINLRLKQELHDRGIHFAHPTQVIYLSSSGNGSSTSQKELVNSVKGQLKAEGQKA